MIIYMVLVTTGGTPEMVYEYVLRENGVSPSEVKIDQSIDFGSTAAAFPAGRGIIPLNLNHPLLLWSSPVTAMW